MNPSVTFVTFAGSPGETDPKYQVIDEARKRLIKQSVKSKVFTNSIGLDWSELENLCNRFDIPIPINVHRYHFTPLILSLISKGAFGRTDYFFYAGSGCEINSNRFALADFRRMIHKARKNIFYVEHTLLPEFLYTKKELFNYLKTSKKDIDTPQIMATFFVVNANADAERLIKISNEWLELSTIHEGELISDSFDKEIQFPEFISHRNDQSILSLILKSNGVKPQIERQRNFSRNFPGLRGSTTFLWTARNRTGFSELPDCTESFVLGFLMFLMTPIANSLHFVRSLSRLHRAPKRRTVEL